MCENHIGPRGIHDLHRNRASQSPTVVPPNPGQNPRISPKGKTIMNNKTKGAIAGIAGIALLAGGTTFALWNDDANANGGIITAGNLEVATVGTTQWVDTSADRTNAGHSINLSAYKIVPGDTIKGTFGIAAALQGDNLVANLGLSLAGNAEGGLLADTKGVTVKYSLVNAATGVALPGAENIALGTPAKVAFAAADNSRNVAPSTVLPTLPADLPAAANLNVVVTATFDVSTDAQLRTKATADLQDLGVTLEQTRTAGTGAGFDPSASPWRIERVRGKHAMSPPHQSHPRSSLQHKGQGNDMTTTLERETDPNQRTSVSTSGGSVLSGLFSGITTALVIVACLLAIALAVVPRLMGGSALTVLTGSMEPRHTSPGDMVAVKAAKASEIQVGDVVTFQPKSGDPMLITHRVITKQLGGTPEGTLFVTQGDANGQPTSRSSPHRSGAWSCTTFPTSGMRPWPSVNTVNSLWSQQPPHS